MRDLLGPVAGYYYLFLFPLVARLAISAFSIFSTVSIKDDWCPVDIGSSEPSDLRGACIVDSSRRTASPKRALPRRPRFRAEPGIESQKRAKSKWTDKRELTQTSLSHPPE